MKKIVSIFILVLTAGSLLAQAPDRSTPPKLEKAKNLQLPPIQRFTLANGLQVMLMEKHTVPLVQINLVIQTGSFDEPVGKEGIGSFTMDMMDEGAGGLDALQLADEIEFLGSSISTYGGSFTSGVTCSAPVSKLDNVLKLMADITLRPSFNEAEVERLRKLRLNSLLQNFDNPNIIAQRAFNKILFDASTPFGRFPTEQSIKAYSKNDCQAFHKTNFVSGNSTLIVVGDVTRASITPILEKHFAAYPTGTVAKTALPVPKQITGRTIYIIDKPAAAQSVIRIGRIGTSRLDPDFNSIIVMNTILGGSFTSRLNTNLREKNGYSYGAGSGFVFWKVPGPFTASSSVQTDVTGPALGEFFKEFDAMRKPLTVEDFERGKNYDALGYAADFETNASIASALTDLVMYQLPDNYFNSYVDKALAVSKKSVEAMAKKYVDPKKMLIIIVGDKAKIEAGITKLNLGKTTILSIEDVLGKKPQL
jgi:zinc protease